MKNNQSLNNTNIFFNIIKTIGIIILIYFILSILFNVVGLINGLFSRRTYSGSELLAETIATIQPNTDYTSTSEEEKSIVLEEMKKDTAIPIDDISTKLTLIEYSDIVVFIKNYDGPKYRYTYNIVFRKTDLGLVFDGSFVIYHNNLINLTKPDVGRIYTNDKNRYLKYNKYDFTSFVKFNAGFNHYSCFSYHDNVSHNIMTNTGITNSWWNPFKWIGQLTSSYTECYTIVSEFVMKDVLNEFTSFNEKQHLMFGDVFDDNLFSNFYTDVFKAVKTLNKNCLVDYTNSSYVGLFEGNVGEENCLYYKANCYFEIDYKQIGYKAYAVNSGNYEKNHSFNCENVCTAIPEITIKLNYNAENSLTSYDEGLDYISKNYSKSLPFANITLTQNETINKFNLAKSTSIVKKYLNLGEHNLTILTDYSIVNFPNTELVATIDVNTSSIILDYSFNSIEDVSPDIPSVKPVLTYGSITLNYIYDEEDISNMMSANSDYLTSNSLGLIEIYGYNSTGVIAYTHTTSIKYGSVGIILEKLSCAYLYKVVLTSPILEFAIDDTTSNKTIETTFKFTAGNTNQQINICYKWNGQVGGFVTI